jgi:hypothetical protein
MPAIEILTGTGRIVAGHPRKPRVRMQDDGKTPALNPDGSKIIEYGFGFAIPKAEWAPIATAMGQAASGVPGANDPSFAWKYRDGDTGLDGDGKPLRDKPGYAGCMVIWVSTRIPDLIKVFKPINATTWQELAENEVKCGDYVRCRLSIEGHGKKPGVASSRPGLYLNPQGIEFVGYGEPIFTGPDASSMFGGAPAAILPPGASATPVAPSGSVAMPSPVPAMAPNAAPAMPPGYPSPTPMVAPSAVPTPAAAPAPIAPVAVPIAPIPAASPAPAPTAFPSSGVAPAHDFVNNAAGRQPVAFDPQTGRPVYGYTLDATGKNWPIYGYDPAGNPVYQ